jgi:small ligand-binding sensory domain FIST
MTHPIIASKLVVGADAEQAATEAARAVAAELGGHADLVVVFASPQLCDDPPAVRAAIAAELAPRHMIGCMGAGVVGTGREVETDAALVVWAAVLPAARITPIRAVGRRDSDGELEISGWPVAEGDDPPDRPRPANGEVVIALADPFSYPVDTLLRIANSAQWRPTIVGGLAAGGDRPGDHVLWLDDEHMCDGLVGVRIGGIDVTTAVSQGCTPIGPDMVVTDGDNAGRIYSLAGAPALSKLQDILDGLDDATLELVNSGITLGIVMNENQPDYQSGDYLMRGILGADADNGAIHVGEQVRVGQTVRLHVRDNVSASDDLHAVTHAAAQRHQREIAGALMFTCIARGAAMFHEAHHDAGVLATRFGDPPVAGLFCNGEFGSVGGRNYLHAFTATIAVFGA